MATVQGRSTRSAVAAPAKRLTLADVTSKSSGLPNRYITHGLEGCGKTSFAAYTPKPVFIQTKGETGLDTLIEFKRLPETPHFPQCQNWDDLLSAVDSLTSTEHEYRTLVIDTLNGAERMCHEEVCRRDFNDIWGEKGFTGFMRGFEVSLAEWRKLLIALDVLRELKQMSIMCLCHTKVKSFKNPEGSDYDRYQPDMHEKTWGMSHRWADAVLFMNFETFVSENDPKKKGKATSTQTRIMFTERHAAYDAKNRHGLPPEIDLGTSGQEAWNNFKAALLAGRNAKGGE